MRPVPTIATSLAAEGFAQVGTLGAAGFRATIPDIRAVIFTGQGGIRHAPGFNYAFATEAAVAYIGRAIAPRGRWNAHARFLARDPALIQRPSNRKAHTAWTAAFASGPLAVWLRPAELFDYRGVIMGDMEINELRLIVKFAPSLNRATPRWSEASGETGIADGADC